MANQHISSEIEIWKPIPGFEDYSVSSLGRFRNKSGLESNPAPKTGDKKSYAQVCLKTENGWKSFRLHRLIILAFYGPSDLHTDHINADKSDNRVCNLESVSNRENRTRFTKNIFKKKYTGVFANKNKWQARAEINNKAVHLGSFHTQEDAYAAYRDYVSKLSVKELP